MQRKTAILGGSGLVGGYLLSFLLKSKAVVQLTSYSRKRIEREHPKFQQILTNFSDEYAIDKSLFAEDIFCAFGTTLSKAGSREKFREIDFNIPLKFATIAKKNGAERFFLVSSIGANATSSNYYLKAKGDLEQSIIELGFEAVYIFRPSFIEGERYEKRFFEVITLPLLKLIAPLLKGKNLKYRPIHAESIAKAMIKCSDREEKGVFIYESDAIAEIASDYIKLDI